LTTRPFLPLGLTSALRARLAACPRRRSASRLRPNAASRAFRSVRSRDVGLPTDAGPAFQLRIFVVWRSRGAHLLAAALEDDLVEVFCPLIEASRFSRSFTQRRLV